MITTSLKRQKGEAAVKDLVLPGAWNRRMKLPNAEEFAGEWGTVDLENEEDDESNAGSSNDDDDGQWIGARKGARMIDLYSDAGGWQCGWKRIAERRGSCVGFICNCRNDVWVLMAGNREIAIWNHDIGAADE